MGTNPASPDELAASDTPRATRRRDDVARFVVRFKELTGFDVNSTSMEGLPRAFLAKPAPSPDFLVRRYQYQLEPRTLNALQRHDPGRYHDRPWTYGRLLEVRGFGVFSLLDVLENLAKTPAPGNENDGATGSGPQNP